MKGKYRLFGKIPVVDILIVVLLVAVCASAVWLLTRKEVSDNTGAEAQVEQTTPFTAVLLVKDITEEHGNLPQVGDELFFKGGASLGKITKIEKEPYGEYHFNELTGQQVYTTLPGKCRLLLTVDGLATSYTEKGIAVGKNRIAYGAAMSVGNEKYYWEMSVIGLGEEDAK
ncbi:MAG: DUF4330 domain-containing protein [Clostridia bacterium]|nr:DUF4330 domain-containing protein [Clostridia bacterium]